MLTTVLVFAALSALLEAIVLYCTLSLESLDNPRYVAALHVLVFCFNLIVHWGTMTGSMTAITAALASILAVPAARCAKRYGPRIAETTREALTTTRDTWRSLNSRWRAHA